MMFFFIFLLAFTGILFFSPSVVGDAMVVKNITVDLSGQGNYKSIQEAVDSIPDFNNQWIRIRVMQGIYNEKVLISSTKTYILLEGVGAENTVIQWGDYVDMMSIDQSKINLTSTDTWGSATIKVLASNFVARDITFKNTHNRLGDISLSQAVAALLGGDKMAFYGCKFVGFQDTLSDFMGRHYFNGCWIEGSVDFIFGSGQSIYENCNVNTVGLDSDGPGYITAQGRDKPDQSNGYVFKNAIISGTRKAYLGRAWGPFARVLFYNSNMADIVVPQGWDAFNAIANPDQTTFAESNCSGPGSDVSDRVKWEKNLSEEEWSTYLSDQFIDPEGWRSLQP